MAQHPTPRRLIGAAILIAVALPAMLLLRADQSSAVQGTQLDAST